MPRVLRQREADRGGTSRADERAHTTAIGGSLRDAQAMPRAFRQRVAEGGDGG